MTASLQRTSGVECETPSPSSDLKMASCVHAWEQIERTTQPQQYVQRPADGREVALPMRFLSAFKLNIRYLFISMTESRQLRKKSHISYEISSDSDSAKISNASESPFGTPQKITGGRKKSTIDFDEEIESEEDDISIDTPPPRLSTAGHSLRQPKSLHQSLRARENADKPSRKKRRISKRMLPRVTSDYPKSAAVKSARSQIRQAISASTAAKKNNFFVAHRHLFLPLLPKKNHITRIVEQREYEQQEEANDVPLKDLSVEFEELPGKPQGITANMKPYQISGLSFLVYLNRNGSSGILGDEMGLGKTLQTLALIQYLKENRQQTATNEQRPSLVVCPLSVLNSWIIEGRKWAPGLKVLRFHGPVHERDRMKRIVMGEIDMYGHETKRNKVRRNDRMIKAGKVVIDLDAESETENEVGVDLVVTTYECFQAEQTWFKRAFVWNYVILDEGHKIKNEKSQISRALQALGAESRLILTGTPLHNNMLELWALLHWLYPEVFTDTTSEAFKQAFDLAKGTVSTTFMDAAKRLLEHIMLRRLKSSAEVDLNLPPKTEVLLYIPLTPMQRFFYTRLMTRADQGLLEELFQNARQKEAQTLEEENQEHILQAKNINQLESLEKTKDVAWQESKAILQQTLELEQQDQTKSTAWRKLMNLLMQLRKVCNHPYLLPHAEPDPYYVGEHVVLASGKLIVLDKLVDELVVRQKKKILIFSEFTRMLDCCEDFLALRGGNGENFRYLRLEGSTSRARRNLWIRLFNQEASEYKVMLISTRAGGLGINLTAASDVVMVDQNWNPQITLQAEARAHRIGQTKPVTIYKLCTQGTVEEQMMGRIQKKLYLSAKVTESMTTVHGSKKMTKSTGDQSAAVDDDMPQLNTNQLTSLVRRGARALAHPELDVNEMLQWDWSTMLQNCSNMSANAMVTKDIGVDATKDEEEERQWLEEIEHVQSRVFQGRKYSREKDDYSTIAKEWSSRADRRVGKETTVMVNGYAVSKESMACGDWEAVPTKAGKDPRLAEVKREKKPSVINQEQKTSDAGGMIFRCRWCQKGYCEDCLDWEKAQLIGDNLKEYELLRFPAISQAYYICCPGCADEHASNPEAKTFYQQQAANFEEEYRLKLQDEDAKLPPIRTPSDTQSLTDATTADDSAIATPFFSTDDGGHSSKKKRKAAPVSFDLDAIPLPENARGGSPDELDTDGLLAVIKRTSVAASKTNSISKRFKPNSFSPKTPVGRRST
ncbi:MAG: hypothetical protein Q9219_005226 [cf. Caloplaca sp. 3 TL-2023]